MSDLYLICDNKRCLFVGPEEVFIDGVCPRCAHEGQSVYNDS